MKKTILPKLAVAVFLTTTVSSASARIIFVDRDARGTDNGSSWQNAYVCLQDALAVCSHGDEIRVAKGVYRPDEYTMITEQFGPQVEHSGDRTDTFQLKDAIVVTGSYAGYGEPDPDSRDFLAYETILSGDLSGDDSSDFVMYSENSYHVVSCSASSAATVLDGFTIVGGNAGRPSYPGFGGGMIVGGGGSPTLINCNFRQNRAEDYGGGIYLIGSRSKIICCTFSGNAAGSGGGACIYSGAPTLINCVFSRNDGGGVRSMAGSSTLVNCIVWGNWSYQVGGAATISYSDIQGGRSGEGNIDADPLFLGPVNGDYHLSVFSPCINAGDPAFSPFPGQTDIDGEPRVIGGRVDMGPDEVNPQGPAIEALPRKFGLLFVPGDPNPGPLILSIRNWGIDRLNWRIMEQCHAVEVFPTAGYSDGEVDNVVINLDISRLSEGNYDCALTLSDPNAVNSPQTVQVNWIIRRPFIRLSATEFKFATAQGGPNPEPQTLTIWNAGGGTLNWEITYDCDWLQVNPSTGSSTTEPNQVELKVDADTLAGGNYSCVLTVAAPGASNTPRNVILNLNVKTPLVSTAPTAVEFLHRIGEPNPEPQTLSIYNSGIGILNWQVAENCNWLNVAPTAGQSSGETDEITLTVDNCSLSPGRYMCDLAISDSRAINSPVIIPVTLIAYTEGCFDVPEIFPTIQSAVNAANAGDTIIVAPDTHTGPGNRDIDFHGKAVTVRSIDPDNWQTVKSTVIDCQSTENDQHRGFYFHSGEDANSVIMGLTITNARASYGAAIRCEDQSSPTITKCLLTKNVASWGAGISSQESSPTIDNCVIVDNVSYDCGLHLYISGYPIVTNCTIAYNLSDREPPSVWFSQPDATISNCIVWFNSAPRTPLHGTFTYCNIEGGRPGIGNIDAEPLFADPEDGDYHLLPDSPCIDAGDPNFIALPGQTDIDGEPRVFNGRTDVGADELFYEGPLIALSARRFEFSAYEGGKNPEPQHLAIHNRGFDTLNWQIAEDCAWLEVTPMTGVSSGELNEVTLSVDISGLLGGLYECELTISDGAAENSPRIVPVTLYVVGPLIDLSACGFEFVAEEGGANPEDQILTIANSGGGILDWTIDYDCNWLEVTPTAASSRGEVNEVTLSVDISALQRGAYNCHLIVSDPNSVNSPQTVEVSLYVTAELVRVPSQFPTIQRAVDFVLQGGTVVVANGIYTGPGNCDIDFRGKAITVRSEHGPENCIIDCNAAYPEWHRGFYFHSGEDSNSVLSGFTITNGSPGILCTQASSPTVNNCYITSDADGSAEWWNNSDGGIRCESDSNALITDCRITNNCASDGGGLYCHSSGPTIRNCVFSGNTAYGCLICVRSFPGSGGAILCDQSNPRITSCVITNNRADCGGGIYCANSNPIIKNCLIAGNGDLGSYGDSRDPEGGGGIYCSASNPMITSCTFTGNIHNYGKGGAIYSFNGSNPIISNCILWDNDATDGSQMALVTYEHYTGKKIYSAATVRYSNIQHSAAMQRRDEQKRDFYDEDLLRALEAVHIDVGCQLKWETGNTDADPLFMQAGYWETNDIRDTWDDFWVDGDCHLKSEGWRWDSQRKIWTWDDATSPCIDAGNPGSPLGQELLTVPADPNNEWGRNIRINMGAYGGTEQASMPPYNWALLADLTNDGTVDWHDFTHAASEWLTTANEQPGDLNRDGVLDFTDLALLAEDWLRRTTWHE